MYFHLYNTRRDLLVVNVPIYSSSHRILPNLILYILNVMRSIKMFHLSNMFKLRIHIYILSVKRFSVADAKVTFINEYILPIASDILHKFSDSNLRRSDAFRTHNCNTSICKMTNIKTIKMFVQQLHDGKFNILFHQRDKTHSIRN